MCILSLYDSVCIHRDKTLYLLIKLTNYNYMNAYTTLDIGLADDDQLIDAKESLISSITAGKGTSLDDIINTLLEVERELTNRETY